MDVPLFLRALGAFFAIMNPFLSLPVFLSLTGSQDVQLQQKTAIRTTYYSAIMCVIIFASGTLVLRFFGINIQNFRIAGGIVLLLISLGMLSGKGFGAHEGSQGERIHQAGVEDVSFFPMTFPLVVGPGTITTIVIIRAQAKDLTGVVSVGLALLVLIISIGIVLFSASKIGKFMSLTLRTITTRLMGMILAAISVEMITNGLKAIFPAWAIVN